VVTRHVAQRRSLRRRVASSSTNDWLGSTVPDALGPSSDALVVIQLRFDNRRFGSHAINTWSFAQSSPGAVYAALTRRNEHSCHAFYPPAALSRRRLRRGTRSCATINTQAL
jgi:hypothetical protein